MTVHLSNERILKGLFKAIDPQTGRLMLYHPVEIIKQEYAGKQVEVMQEMDGRAVSI